MLDHELEKLEYEEDIKAARDALAEIDDLGGVETCCIPAEEFFEQLERERAD